MIDIDNWMRELEEEEDIDIKNNEEYQTKLFEEYVLRGSDHQEERRKLNERYLSGEELMGEHGLRKELAAFDMSYFGRAYLPHYFIRKSPHFHEELDEIWSRGVMKGRNPLKEAKVISRLKGSRQVVAAPRGHAKSTNFTFKDSLHAILYAYKHYILILSDVQAPAGGWIKDLYKGEDAIIAKVEWTPKAAEYLKNKEYRYLSPVVLVRKRDQKATAIHSVALTNTPAIDGMFALVNSLDIEDISEGGNIMDLKELAKALGLPETATEEEIKKAVEDAAKAAEKLKEMDGKKPGEGDGKPGDGEPKPEGADMVANSTILSMLGLKADAKTEDVAASIMALKAGAPDTQAELLALKQRMAERDADEEVQKALKAGKITAAQSEWAKSYALKDMEGFKGFVDKAPVVVPQGKLDLKDAPAASNSDEVDVAILKNMGVSMEDVKKYNKKED